MISHQILKKLTVLFGDPPVISEIVGFTELSSLSEQPVWNNTEFRTKGNGHKGNSTLSSASFW